ncbi:unnamed protein product, partial [Cyprideis torosa]
MSDIRLTGTGVALCTPFDDEKRIDFNALERLVRFNIKEGVEYLVALGTTAETATLSKEEKKDVLQCIINANEGKLPIVLGVGGNDTLSVAKDISLVDFSEIHAILSVSPYYNGPTQEGLYQHYKYLAKETQAPILMYNVPWRTGRNMEPATTLRLANEFPNLIGIKDAPGMKRNSEETTVTYNREEIESKASNIYEAIVVMGKRAEQIASEDKKVLLAVCGGIAAYKSPYIVRHFIKEGAEVKVILTPSAKDFVSPLTLSTLSKNEVHWTFVEDDSWNNHVDLALWADLMIIAPATASTISKMVDGQCDNLVMASYLSAKCPVYIAPAMDLDMYKHPSTAANLDKLRSYKHLIIEAQFGELASGLHGQGRMAEPKDILSCVKEDLLAKASLNGKTVLISAGPTYEYIDP